MKIMWEIQVGTMVVTRSPYRAVIERMERFFEELVRIFDESIVVTQNRVFVSESTEEFYISDEIKRRLQEPIE